MYIGVIGVGVVGKAVLKAFSRVTTTVGYDIVGEYYNIDNWNNIIKRSQVIFVCAPSLTIDGNQDLEPIHSICQQLSDAHYDGVVCIKSTVLPGTCDTLLKKYMLRITHNPEFLTAAKPYEDFMQQKEIIISGHPRNTEVVVSAYRCLFDVPMREYSQFEVTETAKYTRNIFLAVKVTFANEIYELCKHLNIDYNTVLEAMLSQGGIEAGHWKVPGPDGMLGFAGACFPKDLLALNTYLSSNMLNNDVINATHVGNTKRRNFDNMCKEIGTDAKIM